MPDGVHRLIHRHAVVGPQADEATPMKPALENLPMQRAGTFEHDLRARLQLLARMHQSLPLVALDASDEQPLDLAAARHAAADQARREDTRVVDDQHVAGHEQVRERRDCRMSKSPRSLDSGRASATRPARGAAPAQSDRQEDRSRNRGHPKISFYVTGCAEILRATCYDSEVVNRTMCSSSRSMKLGRRFTRGRRDSRATGSVAPRVSR